MSLASQAACSRQGAIDQWTGTAASGATADALNGGGFGRIYRLLVKNERRSTLAEDAQVFLTLDPAPDCDVVNGEVALGHDLLQVAIRQGVSQVPANAKDDDHVFEMPPAEQCWPSSSHDTP